MGRHILGLSFLVLCVVLIIQYLTGEPLAAMLRTTLMIALNAAVLKAVDGKTIEGKAPLQ